MNRLKETWKNRKLIFEGIINKIFKKRYVEKVAAERMNICNSCEQLDTTGKNCLWENTQPCCSECGCSLDFKTRSLSAECPLSYWVAVQKEDEE